MDRTSQRVPHAILERGIAGSGEHLQRDFRRLPGGYARPEVLNDGIHTTPDGVKKALDIWRRRYFVVIEQIPHTLEVPAEAQVLDAEVNLERPAALQHCIGRWRVADGRDRAYRDNRTVVAAPGGC